MTRPADSALGALLMLALTRPCWAGLGPAPDGVPPEWRTRAEVTEFRATSSYAETMSMLERLAGASPAIHMEPYGRSAAGRELPVVVISPEGRFSPTAARAAGVPVVLVQSCIHPGEMDGKDASLMILRDLVLDRSGIDLEGLVVLLVPFVNPDGHERVSPANRVNQNGPDENVGFRGTLNRLDLNRDHMKLASPELRALVGLFNRWRPHLHVDVHVTNGSDHGWVLTWAVAEAPQLAPAVDAWRRRALPRALEATAAAGHPTGPWANLADRLDPTQGINWGPATPRYSNGYFPLRNRLSILVETHAYKPFRDRVLATRAFLVALLNEVGRSSKQLVEAVAAAERTTVALGAVDAEPSPLVLAWQSAARTDTVTVPFKAWDVETSLVSGKPLLCFRPDQIRELEVPWQHAVEPALEVARPRGYLVLPGWPQVEALISAHGLRTSRTTASLTLEVETTRLGAPQLAAETYQGLVRIEAEASRALETREVPAGALWIPADQPDFELAAQLLEPEAPDSVLRWGLVSTVFEHREYVGLQVLESEAEQMLADPAVSAAWRRALEDPGLADDLEARQQWWYRRTPYWDDEYRLMPVLRVLDAGQPGAEVLGVTEQAAAEPAD